MSEDRTTLLEFPCRFPIKAMGRHSEDFEKTVTDIVFAHAHLFENEPLQSRPSRDGNFLSLTLVIEAESQDQLDAIYQGLTDSEAVIMAL